MANSHIGLMETDPLYISPNPCACLYSELISYTIDKWHFISIEDLRIFARFNLEDSLFGIMY
jgi:hypothetical protein